MQQYVTYINYESTNIICIACCRISIQQIDSISFNRSAYKTCNRSRSLSKSGYCSIISSFSTLARAAYLNYKWRK